MRFYPYEKGGVGGGLGGALAMLKGAQQVLG